VNPSDRETSRGRARLFLVGITLLALTLRIWGIRWGLPDGRHPLRSYHPDEALLFNTLSNMNPGRLDLNPNWFGYPSLQYYLQGAWLYLGSLLGQVRLTPDVAHYINHPSDSAALYLWSRWLVVLLGSATPLAVYLAGRNLYGRRAGLWAALWMALVPMHVITSRELKPIVPGVFWLAATLSAATSRGGGRILWPSVVAGLALGTYYTTGIALMAVWLSIVFDCRGQGGSWRRACRLCLLSTLVTTAVFFTTSPGILLEFPKAVRDFFGEASAGSWGHPHWNLYTGYGFGWLGAWSQRFWFGLGPPLEILVLLACAWAAARGGRQGWVLLVPAFLFYVVMGGATTQFLRFLLPLVPFLMIGIGGFVASLRPAIRWGLVLPAAGYTLFYVVAVNRVYCREDPRDRASRWLEERVGKGETVGVVAHPAYALVERRFVHPPCLYVSLKERDRGMRPALQSVLVDMSPVQLHAPDRPRWLVLTSYEEEVIRQGYDTFPYRDLKWRLFLEGLRRGEGYRRIASFSDAPRLGPIPFPLRDPPHDWQYAWPTVSVYERVLGSS
jgi:hypothetical protein